MSKRMGKCEKTNADESTTRIVARNGHDSVDFDCNQNIETGLGLYENICIGCGYGVFDARGNYCNLCQFEANGNRIYETLDRDQSSKSTPAGGKKKNLLHGLIGSLRRTKSNSAPRKLDIVHNVDGFVFATKETFDLDKICELRRITHASDQHIYGKIRRVDIAHQNSQSDPTLDKIRSVEVDLQQQYPATLLPATTDITEWMTSLRCDTHDYHYRGSSETDLSIPSWKCVPSVHEISCGYDFDRRSVVEEEVEVAHTLRRMVDNFRETVMDKRRRCGGIIVDDDDGGDCDAVRRRLPVTGRSSHRRDHLASSRCGALYQSSNRNGIYEKDSDFVSELLSAFDAFLKRDLATPSIVASVTQTETAHTNAVTTAVDVNNLNLTNLIIYFILSSGLNRVVVTYDDHLKVFVNATKRVSGLRVEQLAQLFEKWTAYTQKRRRRRRERPKGITQNPPTMTVPTIITTSDRFKDEDRRRSAVHDVVGDPEPEEDIYQPIWKFKTVGDVPINDPTDPYHIDDDADADAGESRTITDDHGEWEIDDEFMFSTKMRQKDATYVNIMEMRRHYEKSDPYRSVCILYSPLEPRLRAIIYDYDGRHQLTPFMVVSSLSSPPQRLGCGRGGGASDFRMTANEWPSMVRSESRRTTTMPACVGSWRRSLWYAMEDEEDVYVSENEVCQVHYKHSVTPLMDVEPEPQISLQRFKSVSSDNLLNTPDDKKSIAENIKNKFSRGLRKFNVNPREKKTNRFLWRSQTTSLYMEEEIEPKYPIFGADLEDVEKHPFHPNVPLFVVDCVRHIEEKDCIEIDGLYRASGNKVAIDELKRKLTESYIYDSKLIRTDDIHNLTSLLKLFFRESKTPLIPPSYYKSLPEQLTMPSSLPEIKRILLSIPESSRATLDFILKHLSIVSKCSAENRMPASNLAIVWGPCLLSANALGPFDISRMNTLARVLIENYDKIFGDNERLIN